MVKYLNLIKARAQKFGVKERYIDDFIQEGLFMLIIAARTYDSNSEKTFNKYFDLILIRKFQRLMEKEKEYFFNVYMETSLAKNLPANMQETWVQSLVQEDPTCFRVTKPVCLN